MINSLSSLHRKTGPPHPTSLPRKTEKRCPNQRWRPCGWHLASSVPWRRPNPKSPMTSSTKLVKDRRHPTVRRRPAASRRYRRWCRHRRRRLAPMTPLPSNWSPVTCTRRRPICSTRSRERWCWPIASRRAVRTPAVRRSTTRRACASSSAPTPTRFRVSAFESHRPKRLPINRRLSSVLFCFSSFSLFSSLSVLLPSWSLFIVYGRDRHQVLWRRRNSPSSRCTCRRTVWKSRRRLIRPNRSPTDAARCASTWAASATLPGPARNRRRSAPSRSAPTPSAAAPGVSNASKDTSWTRCPNAAVVSPAARPARSSVSANANSPAGRFPFLKKKIIKKNQHWVVKLRHPKLRMDIELWNTC